MMGRLEPQKDLFSYHIDLDRRVRADHRLRQINATVDWSFVRPLVAHTYGHNGNESVDPVVIVKLMFLLFYDDVKSERQLMEIVPERLDYLWFLGYGLDADVPDHSVLSKARARWGEDVFEELFLRSVAQACAAGLVDGKKLHLDSSLIDAHAAAQKTVPGPPELIAALKAAYQVEETKLEERPRRAHYQKKNKSLLNTTDPDAPMMSRGPGNKFAQARPRYKEHRVVDDQCGIITAVETTGADVEDGDVMEELIDAHEQNTEHQAETIVSDSHYGTRENFRALQERGFITHMAVRRPPGPAVPKGKFPASDFHYEPPRDAYLCPAGARLRRRNYDRFRQAWLYRTDAGVCARCPLREHCTPARRGRVLMRYEGQEEIDRGLAQAQSAAAQRDRRRRQHLVEGSFAEAVNEHHFRRARWRRLWRQRIQSWLIAAVQNIKKLVRASAPWRAALSVRRLRPCSPCGWPAPVPTHPRSFPLSLSCPALALSNWAFGQQTRNFRFRG